MKFDRPVKFGFAGAVVVLVALGIYGEQSNRQLGRIAQQRSDTWRFLLDAERTYSNLKEMEESQRSFLLTGEDQYRRNFNEQSSLLASRLEDLRGGTQALPDQLESLSKVTDLSRRRKEELQVGINLRAEKGLGAAVAGRKAETSQMPEIGALLALVGERGAREIASRTASINRVVNLTAAVSLTSTILAIGLCGLALFFFQRRSLRHRAVIEENEGLRKEMDGLRRKLATVVDGQNLAVKALQETERALAESRQRAQAATRAKSEFLANMSHEIRTPLNGILGMTSIMLDSGLNPEQLDYGKTIQRSGESLLGLLNDILDFSKVEAGKIDFESVNFDIAASARDLLKTFQYASKRKGVELIGEIPAGAHFFHGDPGRIRQILVNLLGNALKFTEKGSVTLRLRIIPVGIEGSRLRFEVQDTGIGIDERTVPHLFRAFSQGDASTTRKFGGTGLGLFISRKLVEAMDGIIGLTSVKEKGSTFWFELTLKAGETRHHAEPKAEIRQVNGKYRVLVAEDNEVNQKIVLKMLEKMGIRAECVTNGAEVLEALRKRSYDLILMDCQMPVMDGYEATARVRNDRVVGNNNIPIIAMTANAMKGDREHCLASGMNDYLAKPLSANRLSETLEKWIAEVDRRKHEAYVLG
jgi:signal transduction histidine kinase/ActR/RegA family two-component response regulator